LSAAKYTVTVTDANGCTTTKVVNLTNGRKLSVGYVSVGAKCSNPYGYIRAKVSSTQISRVQSYAWSNGATTSTIDSLSPGTYTLTISYDNGCEVIKSFTHAPLPCCNVTKAGAIGPAQNNCGGFDPAPITSISLPTGGIGNLEYVWLQRQPGQAFSQISGANGPTYDPGFISTTMQYRRCARRSGCTSYVGESNWVTITIKPLPTIGFTNVNGTCSNNMLGTSLATGGVAYTWSNGSNSQKITGLTAGTYTVTVTKGNGCTNTAQTVITSVECCNVTSAGVIGSAQENCGGFDPAPLTSISLPSGGIGNIEYVWLQRQPGQSYSAISGANGPTYDPGFISTTMQYRRCARRSGCTSFVGESNWVTITVNEAPTASIASENGTCSNNMEGSAAASGGTSFAWSNGATTASISGLASGTYTVAVSNGNGCTDTEEVSITNVECCNVTSAGEIGNEQSNCEAFNPDAITSISLPSGGVGNIEYVWLKRFPGQAYSQISGANGPTYDPGFITQTTEYRRCARRNGCTSFVGESNWISMGVDTGGCNFSCDGFRTQTQGGWGASPSGNNPGTYLHQHFSGAFPNGLSIGCNNSLNLTTASAVTAFLPSGSTAQMLPTGTLTDPNTNYSNVLAGQLVAATLNIGFDSYDANFGSSTIFVGDLIYSNNSVFDGMTVSTVVQLANDFIGGCTSTYNASELNNALTSFNESYVDGIVNGSSFECPPVCDNVTSAGEIGNEQSNCEAFNPDAITSISLPSGGNGALEYVWLKRFPGQSYSVIVGENGSTYDPGMISQTTEYRRCARRDGCSAYPGESNWVTMTVNETPEYSTKYKIDAGSWTYDSVVYVCAGQKLYLGIYPNSFNSISWTGPNNFSSTISHPLITSSVTSAHAGTYTVTASNGSCSTTKNIEVVVTNNCCGEILALKIYDQTTDQEVSGVGAITNGMTILSGSLPSDYYLVVETTSNIESVKIIINGNTQNTENVVPYTWPNGAENGTNWNGGEGSFSVKASAYTQDNCQPVVCDELELVFTITDCDNVTSAGEIGNAQTACNAFDPEPITSISLPSGGTGTIEYVWLQREPNQGYTVISGANGPTYDPGMISTTMEYRRCSRRNGCTSYVGESNWITMTIGGNLSVELTTTSPLCAGSMGSIEAMAFGTNPTYSWSNGGTGMIQTGLGSGMYTVTVTDGGCSVEDSAEIIVPEPLELSFIATSQSYPGAGDGTLQAVVLGGTPAYSYSWQTGATTATLGGIVYGWFNVTVTDANGCMISDSGYVTPGAIGKTAKSTSTEATDIADISFTAFPNPTVKGSSVWMAIENVMLDEKTTVQLYDLTGQLILSEQHSIVKGSNKVELNGSRELSAGSYIIRLNAGDQVITSRILVSN
jgi:hypothetical protein